MMSGLAGRRLRPLIVLLGVVVLAAGLVFYLISAHGKPDLHLSPAGNDAGPCSSSSPCRTLERAQEVARASGTKIIYLRKGVYVRSHMFTLTAADNGQTWSIDPADPVGSAVLDASGMSLNSPADTNVILIQGGSGITVNGLQVRNFPGGGISVHGGPAYFDVPLNEQPEYAAAGAAHDNVISNNLVHDGHSPVTGEPPWPTWWGGINAWGDVRATVIKNNVVHDITSAGIIGGALQMGPHHGIDDLVIARNVVYRVNTESKDSGGIYLVDRTGSSSNIRVSDNVVRDYGRPEKQTKGIYLDDDVSNVAVTGNVVAGAGTWAFQFHSGKDNHVAGNVVDLAVGQSIMLYQNDGDARGMTGNSFTNNIVISPGGGGGFEAGYGKAFTSPVVNHNDYWNYGGSSVSHGTTGYTRAGTISDTAAVHVDPQLTCWPYGIATASAVHGPPVAFPSLVDDWGPPGYRVPLAGTAPSYPEPAPCRP